MLLERGRSHLTEPLIVLAKKKCKRFTEASLSRLTKKKKLLDRSGFNLFMFLFFNYFFICSCRCYSPPRSIRNKRLSATQFIALNHKVNCESLTVTQEEDSHPLKLRRNQTEPPAGVVDVAGVSAWLCGRVGAAERKEFPNISTSTCGGQNLEPRLLVRLLHTER